MKANTEMLNIEVDIKKITAKEAECIAKLVRKNIGEIKFTGSRFKQEYIAIEVISENNNYVQKNHYIFIGVDGKIFEHFENINKNREIGCVDYVEIINYLRKEHIISE
ncbi:MAG: hypothetical protein WCI41_03570 [bacterium]